MAHLRAAVFWLLLGTLAVCGHRGGFVVTTGHSPPPFSRRPANPAHSRNDQAAPLCNIPVARAAASPFYSPEYAVGGELAAAHRASSPRRSLSPHRRPGRALSSRQLGRHHR
ncbi:hypothetical protein AURDEDRAFT_176824 [Auricularia subglabra TFB-10046 SS5]|uniref:Uncharacterized protein n=1 Tax=Auricularia subglabra (strain TFB-10046 / SS5) TaxID=717982 RepID=J0CUT1_AURST|nr:hypothetical protein AURDEDRAFT_176824 [Auricularia subglabra TFB-10046 SS5]